MGRDSAQTISSSIKRFFSGTLLSRFSGMGREILMAAAFGAAPPVAAFWMAFRFASLLRRLFGEGGLHVAFIPHFESIRAKDPERAALFFHQLSFGLTFFLILLVLIGEGVLGYFLIDPLLGQGAREILRLSMILLPASIFICLFALNQSLLHCQQSYFTPSVAPAVFNFAWMGAVIWLWNAPLSNAMEYLAIIVVFAFAFQWLVTVPPVYKFLSEGLGKSWWKQKKRFGKEILGLLRPFALGLIGVAATQVNNALDAIFARIADSEGPALLWYALRIQQLPMALLGVGLMGALLPPISRAIEANDAEKYRHFLFFALEKAVAWMIPITLGILVAGLSSVNLLFGRGEFTQGATFETTRCLWAYALGLFPSTLVLIFAAAFYAKKNYRTPTIISVFTVALNVGLNALFVFVFKWSAISIALATAFAAFFNALLLGIALAKADGLPLFPLARPFFRVTFCSALAAVFALTLSRVLFGDSTSLLFWNLPTLPLQRNSLFQLLAFCENAFLYGGVLIAFAALFRIHEIVSLVAPIIKWARGRKAISD